LAYLARTTNSRPCHGKLCWRRPASTAQPPETYPACGGLPPQERLQTRDFDAWARCSLRAASSGALHVAHSILPAGTVMSTARQQAAAIENMTNLKPDQRGQRCGARALANAGPVRLTSRVKEVGNETI